MTEPNIEGFTDIVDDVSLDTLRTLASLEGPVASLLMPTRRDVRDPAHDSLQLRNLADEAAARLRDRGADADAILKPVHALVADRAFWHNQAEGLAIYAAPSGTHVFRLPREVPLVAQVGDAPRLLPLTRVATGDEAFHILALSQNSVRLFAATRDSIHALDLGSMPTSVAAMEGSASREPQLQHQHAPRGTASFHGHGGSDSEDVGVQRFISEVASGVRERIGAGSARPLVLAGVAEHVPALQATGRLPTLLPDGVTGNSEHLSPGELLERAWPIVASVLTGRRAERGERLAAARGTGTAVTDPTELRRAAAEGRIATVLSPVQAAPGAERPDADDDEAVAAALRTGADLAVADLPDEIPMAALLRY